MTVRELIAELREQDQDMTVLFSNDPEGNHLHAEATIELTEGYDEEDEEKTAVVIYPVN